MKKILPLNVSRRQLIKNIGLAIATTPLISLSQALSQPPKSDRLTLLPPRLKVGDTIGLIAPAGFVEAKDLFRLQQMLDRLGLKFKLGKHLLDRHGYFAGQDIDRAADVNNMFADRSVQGIMAVEGGWGCARILPFLDYNLIRRFPKMIMGFSDVTALLISIYHKTGLITFHGPLGVSSWPPFAVNYFQKLLFEGEPVLFNSSTMSNYNSAQVKTRREVIQSGQAHGQLIGGNLSVLAGLIGSEYLPTWENKILFLEDTGEEVYRVDRFLTQLSLAGILSRLSGFIFGQCTYCDPEKPMESLSLSQVLQEHIKPLGIVAWYGSAIGHIADQFTLPIGINVEIDADQGTIKMLEKAVI